MMLNSVNLLNINDSPNSTYKTLNQRDIVNQNGVSSKRENVTNLYSTKNSKYSQNISHKNLFKQQINEKINSCDFNSNVNFNNNNPTNSHLNNNCVLETNLINITEGNVAGNNNNYPNQNNLNSTTKNQIHNKKISDIPLLSSLNFNKTQKKTEFYSENSIKPSNIIGSQNLFKNIHHNQTNIQNNNNINNNYNNLIKVNANQKLIKSAYFNSANSNNKIINNNKNNNYETLNNKVNLNINNLDHLQLKKMSQFSVPISNITSKKNSQNNSKSISRLDDFDNKIMNNNKNINLNNENLINNINNSNQKEEIDADRKAKFINPNKTNSLMSKFLPITTSNSPKQLTNKELLKNINNRKDNEEGKSINITTSYKIRDNSKNNNEFKNNSNHKFFLDLNKLKENKNDKDNPGATASFDYEDESRSKILLETSNESIRSTLRESIYYRKEAERLSNYIKNCKINNHLI